jgi:DNA-binding cell septation regulator SpoVG
MNRKDIAVIIERTNRPGSLKAFAIVKVAFPNGEIKMHGFSVIEQPGKPAWVGFPSKKGNVQGKYFPVTEADGELRIEISAAVLDAYKKIL